MPRPFQSLWNRFFGESGERAAAAHLRARNMRIIARNYRARGGEIDLIARDGDTLVFVEVKTRKFGLPAEAVNMEKQKRLTRTALQFLRENQLLSARVPCRFDVVSIIWADLNQKPLIEHIPNAFEGAGDSGMFS